MGAGASSQELPRGAQDFSLPASDGVAQQATAHQVPGGSISRQLRLATAVCQWRSKAARTRHQDPSTGSAKRYLVLGAPETERWAEELVRLGGSERFQYCATQWENFADGTDKIFLGGFQPQNKVRGSHVLFLACFASNSVTLTQYYALVAIAESFVESLTILLPYYPTGTMERVLVEGEVATAHTTARMLSSLPCLGRPARVMLYDLHTLQNRFYFGGRAIATLHTAFPLIVDLMIEQIRGPDAKEAIDCICFPDDGAEKRFKHLFAQVLTYTALEIVVCAKKRDATDAMARKVVIADGFPRGRHCLIVDDLVQSGGTLHECAKVLLAEGVLSVSAFVTHAVFPKESWRSFLRGGERGIFRHFFTTDSNPHIAAQLPANDVFRVMPLMGQVLEDL